MGIKMFGRSYSQVGSSSEDLILKTRGQVKIQWGNKFIDLIQDGKVVSGASSLIQTVSSIDSATSDGLYYISSDKSLYVVVSSNKIPIVGDTTTYVSFLTEQTTTGDQKYQALKNIGFIYTSFEDAQQAQITSGVVYVESTQKLYIVSAGQLVEYTMQIPDTITKSVQINNPNGINLTLLGNNKQGGIYFNDGDISIYRQGDDLYLDNILGNIIINSILSVSINGITSQVPIISHSFQTSDYSANNSTGTYIGDTITTDNIITRDINSQLFNNNYVSTWNRIKDKTTGTILSQYNNKIRSYTVNYPTSSYITNKTDTTKYYCDTRSYNINQRQLLDTEILTLTNVEGNLANSNLIVENITDIQIVSVKYKAPNATEFLAATNYIVYATSGTVSSNWSSYLKDSIYEISNVGSFDSFTISNCTAYIQERSLELSSGSDLNVSDTFTRSDGNTTSQSSIIYSTCGKINNNTDVLFKANQAITSDTSEGDVKYSVTLTTTYSIVSSVSGKNIINILRVYNFAEIITKYSAHLKLLYNFQGKYKIGDQFLLQYYTQDSYGYAQQQIIPIQIIYIKDNYDIISKQYNTTGAVYTTTTKTKGYIIFSFITDSFNQNILNNLYNQTLYFIGRSIESGDTKSDKTLQSLVQTESGIDLMQSTAYSDISNVDNIKTRIGNLEGIIKSGVTMSGYGIYTDNLVAYKPKLIQADVDLDYTQVKTYINNGINTALPIGTVIMWGRLGYNGDNTQYYDIPDGWYLCNGQEVTLNSITYKTPNLTGYVPMGIQGHTTITTNKLKLETDTTQQTVDTASIMFIIKLSDRTFV